MDARACFTENVAAPNSEEIVQTNAGLEFLVQDLRAEVTTMHTKIANAERRAEEAQKTAAEAQVEQTRVSNKLLQAKKALEEEQKMREQLAWRSLGTIDQLKVELAQTQQAVKSQTVTAQDIGGLRAELQQTQQKVQAQCDEIAGMEKFSDEMM